LSLDTSDFAALEFHRELARAARADVGDLDRLDERAANRFLSASKPHGISRIPAEQSNAEGNAGACALDVIGSSLSRRPSGHELGKIVPVEPAAGTPHWLTARLTLTHALKPSRPGHARRA